jgi:hypothetical protein
LKRCATAQSARRDAPILSEFNDERPHEALARLGQSDFVAA